MTNKIILLCSLLVIPCVVFGMEEEKQSKIFVTGYDSKDLETIRQLPILESIYQHEPGPREAVLEYPNNTNFAMHWSKESGKAVIHQKEKVVERITFKDENNSLTTFYTSTFPSLVPYCGVIKPYFFITVIKKDQVLSYRITSVKEYCPISNLDRIVREDKQKKIVTSIVSQKQSPTGIVHKIIQNEKSIGNQKINWQTLIGGFVCGVTCAAGFVIFWFVKTFRYNK